MFLKMLSLLQIMVKELFSENLKTFLKIWKKSLRSFFRYFCPNIEKFQKITFSEKVKKFRKTEIFSIFEEDFLKSRSKIITKTLISGEIMIIKNFSENLEKIYPSIFSIFFQKANIHFFRKKSKFSKKI